MEEKAKSAGAEVVISLCLLCCVLLGRLRGWYIIVCIKTNKILVCVFCVCLVSSGHSATHQKNRSKECEQQEVLLSFFLPFFFHFYWTFVNKEDKDPGQGMVAPPWLTKEDYYSALSMAYHVLAFVVYLRCQDQEQGRRVRFLS